MLICFTNIKAKKRPLRGVVKKGFKILFVKAGNLRMAAKHINKIPVSACTLCVAHRFNLPDRILVE